MFLQSKEEIPLLLNMTRTPSICGWIHFVLFAPTRSLTRGQPLPRCTTRTPVRSSQTIDLLKRLSHLSNKLYRIWKLCISVGKASLSSVSWVCNLPIIVRTTLAMLSSIVRGGGEVLLGWEGVVEGAASRLDSSSERHELDSFTARCPLCSTACTKHNNRGIFGCVRKSWSHLRHLTWGKYFFFFHFLGRERFNYLEVLSTIEMFSLIM